MTVTAQSHHMALVVLTVSTAQVDVLDAQINKIKNTRPNDYQFAPVVVAVAEDIVFSATDLAILIELLTQHQMVVVGIQSKNKTLIDYARISNLAVFPIERRKKSLSNPMAKLEADTKGAQPLIIDHSVSSGKQIYSDKQTVIVAGDVEAGAEIVSSKRVFIYGTAKGNIFAGVADNSDAHIFVHRFQANLVCIAGVYRQFKQVPKELYNQAVNIYLEKDKLFFDILAS